MSENRLFSPTVKSSAKAPTGVQLFVRRFTWASLIAAAFIIFVALLAILAPWLGLPDPTQQNAGIRMSPVGTAGHILGTDQSGRDILSRLIFGARAELVTALGATLLATLIGVTIGLVAGYMKGFVRGFLMRMIDVVLTIPALILALFAVTLYGAGTLTLVVAIGITLIPSFARITYGQVLIVREAEFVEADKLYGRKPFSIMFGAVLPNVSAAIIVQFTLNIAAAILLETGLSFIGLGIVPPEPSWGSMVAEGQRYMIDNPMLILIPSLAVVLTILAFGVVGDGLRGWMDPRNRKRTN